MGFNYDYVNEYGLGVYYGFSVRCRGDVRQFGD
jgi:hypothetical protein